MIIVQFVNEMFETAGFEWRALNKSAVEREIICSRRVINERNVKGLLWICISSYNTRGLIFRFIREHVVYITLDEMKDFFFGISYKILQCIAIITILKECDR